jgi:ribonuclease P protein component
MVPAANRLRSRTDFSLALKGVRARVGSLVVHAANRGDDLEPRIGFIANRQVGGSVVRHRVVRRLRAASAGAIRHLPPGTNVVVRALPAAAAQTSVELSAAFEQALARLDLLR